MAEPYFAKYIERLRPEGPTIELGDMLRKLGECRAALGDLDDAEKLFTESASVFEVARLAVTPGIKSATFKPTPYEQLALVRLERGRIPEAWPALEAARARVLADLLVAAEVPRAERACRTPRSPSIASRRVLGRSARSSAGWISGCTPTMRRPGATSSATKARSGGYACRRTNR
jgi:tetratricopeptide (TPR) repeat protein